MFISHAGWFYHTCSHYLSVLSRASAAAASASCKLVFCARSFTRHKRTRNACVRQYSSSTPPLCVNCGRPETNSHHATTAAQTFVCSDIQASRSVLFSVENLSRELDASIASFCFRFSGNVLYETKSRYPHRRESIRADFLQHFGPQVKPRYVSSMQPNSAGCVTPASEKNMKFFK